MLIKSILNTLVLTFGSWVFVSAQPKQPPVINFTPHEYGDNQPQENYSITKDDRGFIYVGNVGGVLQYDGHTWNFIEVVTGVKINDIAFAGNNTFAVGGLNYMGIIAPDESGKLKYQSLNRLVEKDLSNFEIITIQVVGDEVFFQSENAIFIYKNKSVKTIKPQDSFFRGYAVNGRYFVRDRNYGLKEWKKGLMKQFATDSISKGYGYFGIVDYDKDRFLVVTHDLGFYFLNKKTGEIEPYTSFFYEDFLPQVYDVEKLENDLYALATINHGVIILDKDLELKARIGRNDGLKSSFINQICADHSGNIWAATSSGISMVDIHSPLDFFGESSGLPGNIEDVQKLGTNYYAASWAGLFYLPENYTDDSKPWRKIELIKSQVYDLDKNEKDIFVASGNGLFAGTLESFKKLNEGDYQSVRYIQGINNIVALTSSRIEIYKNDYTISKVMPLPVHVQRSQNIEYDTSVAGRTRIWVGLVKQGVLRIDIFENSEINIQLFTEEDGVMPGVVRPCNFLGKIIFLTENGLQHFISEEEVAKSLTEEEKNNPDFLRGYFDVYQIPEKELKGKISSLELNNGRIYVVQNDKLCYYDQQGKLYKKEFSTLRLGRINSLNIIEDRLWIPASEGMAVFNPNHFKKMDRKFHVYFRSIVAKEKVVMNEFFRTDHGFFNIHKEENQVAFNYSENTLHFVFSSDYFDLQNKLEYAWYLEGSEQGWSKWSHENKITLSNLHEGDYVLHVKARNIYGMESEVSKYHFSVLPPWYRTWWAYVLYVVLIIIIIYVAIRISVYQLKQSNIRLENIVKERTLEIASKNDELQHQNHQILHQKQEITDSINYARRIQEAILPINKEIQKAFPDSFVLFKPKDIVSGDFYWFAHRDQLSIFICADCTGHGVPGAFMSMICTDRLNHTVLEKKIITPSAMLSEVNQGIKRSLKQEDESDLKTKDGMDAAVCSFDHSKNELLYAGANRPLWLLRNGEITEYKPTKMAVGGFTPEDQIYEENRIQIQKGDIVYLSTDGYADQFGGPKGKKLMVKAFKEILIKNSHLPFTEQKMVLDKFIEDWRNTKNDSGEDIEQVDDMCVIGIRF